MIFVFFLILHILFTKTDVTNWGDMARLATVESLAERFTFSINNATFSQTGDKILLNGNYYGVQPPLMPFVTSGVYFLISKILGISFSANRALAYYIITLLTVGLPVSFMLTCFYLSLRFLLIGQGPRLFLTAALAGASLLSCYSVSYNSHAPAAALLFLSFYLLLKIRFEACSPRLRYFWLGFWSSLSFALDPIPGGLFSVLYLFYLLTESSQRFRIWLYLSGVGLPLIVHLALNIIISGGIKPLTLHPDYPLAVGPDKHFAIASFGIYAFQSLFGIRGLFSYTPALIPAMIFLIRILASPRHHFHKEALVVGIGLAGSIFLTLLVTDNYGGWCYGVRYFVPLIPILFFFNGFIFLKYCPFLKPCFYVLLGLSGFINLIGLADPGTDSSQSDFSLATNLQLIRNQSPEKLVKMYFPFTGLTYENNALENNSNY